MPPPDEPAAPAADTVAPVGAGGGGAGDGLLGRDFLDHFSVHIDSAKGIVTLTPK